MFFVSMEFEKQIWLDLDISKFVKL
jgi:hypothetical protein